MMHSIAMRSSVRFCIANWSAWAPGLTDTEAWRAWARQPSLPTGTERPELSTFPPLLRRRAERLARMALATAQALRGADDCPKIFASARGEIQRSVQMLTELAQEGRVGPGPFSLSVHNAVAALDSIAHQDTGYYSAVAAGRETAEAALVEACALLADGADRVLVTVYDETLPDIYRGDADDTDAAYAWSWLVTAAPAGAGIELAWEPRGHETARGSAALPAAGPTVPSQTLPHALDVLRFALSDDSELTHDGPHQRWTWRRSA